MPITSGNQGPNPYAGYFWDNQSGSWRPSPNATPPASAASGPGGNPVNPDRYKNNPFDLYSNDYNEQRRAQDYRDQVDKSLMDQAGRPTLPGFQSALGQNGQIKDIYKTNPSLINGAIVDQRGIDAVRSRALGTGPSPWLNLQLAQQGENEKKGINQAIAGNAGNVASAESNLAMRGGLQSGARERLAKAGFQNADASVQGVHSQGANDRSNLQIADENTRSQLLSQLPGMEVANAQPMLNAEEFNANQQSGADRFNVQNSLNDLLQKRAYDLGAYGEGMKAWAAGKTADAQSGGGKK